MIWPIEADDALDQLRQVRETLGSAVDGLHILCASAESIAAFQQAHDAVSWAIEHVTDTMTVRSRTAVDAEQVEVRHVDAQVMPWMEADDAW